MLLAGMALRPLPAAVYEPFLGAAMAVVARRHTALFTRLDEFRGAVVLVDPVDLPVALALHIDPEHPRVRVADPADVADARAAIRGPLLALLDVLEGRVDGDALFFSRDLVVEGDTAAVVALRNALDGEQIDLVDDLLSVLGPLAHPARTALQAGAGLLARAAADLEALRAGIIAPALYASDSLAGELRRLSDRIAALEQQRAPSRRAVSRRGERA
jgi:predicted lipid carrier protein YhbT